MWTQTVILPRRVAVANQVLTPAASTALTLPAASVAPTGQVQYAQVSVTGGDIRYWEDGSAPTANDGIFMADGEKFEIIGSENLAKFRMINAAGAPRVCVQYYAEPIPTQINP